MMRTSAVKEKRSGVEACRRGGAKYAGKMGQWREELMNRREKEKKKKKRRKGRITEACP